ncbi:MAG: flagellar hook-basal body protein [Tepidisphaerales bacterium]
MFHRAFLATMLIGISAGGCAAPSANSQAVRVIAAIDAAKEIATTNLCHAETIGYKRLVPRVDGDGNMTVTPDWEQGCMENTGRPLDVAIVGNGFFMVKKDGQTFFTRNGNLFVSTDGRLVLGTTGEYVLDPQLIILREATSITISDDGMTAYLLPGQVMPQLAGGLRLASFASPQGLRRVGPNLYQQTDASGPARISDPGKCGLGTLQQGHLEGSNVSLVAESMRLQRLDQWRAILTDTGAMPPELRELARAGHGSATAGVHSAAGPSATANGRTVLAIDAARQIAQHNISNAETTAYKRSRVVFDDNGISCTQLNMEQGSMANTNRPLDLAIEGVGFFRVKIQAGIGDGYAYTRCGNLFVNKDGQLVVGTGDGCRLEPQITIPPSGTGITIALDGSVTYLVPGQVNRASAGRIQLANFTNPNGLTALHGSILLQTESSGQPVLGDPGKQGLGLLQQTFLEQSNVDIAAERATLRRLGEWRATLLAAMGLKAEPTQQVAEP